MIGGINLDEQQEDPWNNAPRTNLNDTKTNPLQPYTTMAGHGSTRRRLVLISESPIFGKLTKPSTNRTRCNTHAHKA
jgi:hypothetical protein